MDSGRELPLPDDCLAAESGQGLEDATGLPTRIHRYRRAHQRALRMADYAAAQGEVNLAHKLHSCGEWLLFRQYYRVDDAWKLHAGHFCRKHLLCQLCAIRRGAKQVQAYVERLAVVLDREPDLRLSLVTLTVKDGPDLGERFRHLSGSFRKLQQARRSHLRGKGPHVALANVEGAVGSYEFKRGQNSGQWHPHLHMVCLHRLPIDGGQLSRDWKAITGDSWIVDVRPFHAGQEPVDGFLEVFKYALKFSDMSEADNWEGFQTLSRQRLVFSFGLFWGVQVPETLTDEELQDEPYLELLYRFFAKAGYSVVATGSDRSPARAPNAAQKGASFAWSSIMKKPLDKTAKTF